MRLIDADAMKEKWKPYLESEALDLFGEGFQQGFSCIDHMPTIDAEPVVHAHWIHRLDVWQLSRHYIKCSKCGREYLAAKYKGELPGLTDEMIAVVGGHFPYCHCGAKMDEEDKHEID